jgi:DNA polymerase III epsilon subunit-like protein
MNTNAPGMVYISVDIETGGPTPNNYALLSVGACLVDNPDVSFYVELMPDKEKIEPSAIKIAGLDPEVLKRDGTPPNEAMQAFESWLQDHTSEGEQPVFVAFNAAFDWMFVADYFQRYLGRNPFGYSALDIKALYMGAFGVPWEETGMAEVTKRLGFSIQLSHNALEDARDQALIFNTLLQKISENEMR